MAVVVPLYRRERKKLGRPPRPAPAVTLSVEAIEVEESVASAYLVWEYDGRRMRIAMTRDEIENLVRELNHHKYRRK